MSMFTAHINDRNYVISHDQHYGASACQADVIFVVPATVPKYAR